MPIIIHTNITLKQQIITPYLGQQCHIGLNSAWLMYACTPRAPIFHRCHTRGYVVRTQLRVHIFHKTSLFVSSGCCTSEINMVDSLPVCLDRQDLQVVRLIELVPQRVLLLNNHYLALLVHLNNRVKIDTSTLSSSGGSPCSRVTFFSRALEACIINLEYSSNLTSYCLFFLLASLLIALYFMPTQKLVKHACSYINRVVHS